MFLGGGWDEDRLVEMKKGAGSRDPPLPRCGVPLEMCWILVIDSEACGVAPVSYSKKKREDTIQ